MRKFNFAVPLFLLIIFNLNTFQTFAGEQKKEIVKLENNTETVPIVPIEKIVKVGLYIINIGKFDISTGSYTIDFYLTLKCAGKCPVIGYEFMNGRAASVDKIMDEPNEKQYRIQANLCSPIDLRKFPFDEQKIIISLEDKLQTIDKIEYIPDLERIAIDTSVVITGWNMKKWKAETLTHEYKVYNEKYSQLIFTIPISRIALNSFLKTLLPIIFIIVVMLSSFILAPDKLTTRIAMVSSALVASVMFHVSLANQIPPVGYLTFTDKFMGLTYFVILTCFIINVTLMGLIELKKTELVDKLNRKTKYTMFISIPIIYVLFFVFTK